MANEEAKEDEDNPVPSLEVPAPVAFERASESVVATGQFGAVNQVGAISSSPLLVAGVAAPAESSLNVASTVQSGVPISFDSSRADHRASLRIGQPKKNELPLKTLVMIAGGIVLAGILFSLLLFR